MSIKIGHAVHDENGKISGGQAGDQTGKEVVTRDWYKTTWHTVLRAKDSKVAEKIAQAMKTACDNNNIGYDQKQRTTLFAAAQTVGFDLSKVATKCETDCSALVAVCVNSAGVKVSKDIYTGNMVDALKATGAFTLYTDSKYLTSDTHLKRGDILVKNGHTAVVLENGSKASATQPETTQPPTSGSGAFVVSKVHSYKAIVNVNALMFRKYATAVSKKIGKFERGDILIAIRKSGKWAFVYAPKYGCTGWVFLSYIKTSSLEYSSEVIPMQKIIGTKGDGLWGWDSSLRFYDWQKTHGLKADAQLGKYSVEKAGGKWKG